MKGKKRKVHTEIIMISPDVFSHSAIDLCWNRSCLHLLQLMSACFVERMPNLLDSTVSFTDSPFWSSLTFFGPFVSSFPSICSYCVRGIKRYFFACSFSICLCTTVGVTTYSRKCQNEACWISQKTIFCLLSWCTRPWDWLLSTHVFFIDCNCCSANLLLLSGARGSHQSGMARSTVGQLKLCVSEDFGATELDLNTDVSSKYKLCYSWWPSYSQHY